jgi:hypothetical protein
MRVQGMSSQWLNIVGLDATLVGVLLLFRYGMPYRVRTGGNVATWHTESPDPKIVALERRYSTAGWIGIVLVLIGTGLQIAASLMP